MSVVTASDHSSINIVEININIYYIFCDVLPGEAVYFTDMCNCQLELSLAIQFVLPAYYSGKICRR